MMNIKLVLTCIVVAFWSICAFAQQSEPISKKRFEELWNKADSSAKIVIKTGTTTKDLNAAERNNINSIDLKQKTVTNPNYKPIDTSNLDALSPKPIIKGSSKAAEKPKEATIVLPAKDSKNNSAPIESKPIVKESVKSKPAEPKPVVKGKEEVKEVIKSKTTESKPATKTNNEDFSSKPIVKGKTTTASETKTTTSSKKYTIDTTKGFREFTFETKPIVSGNASYYRKDEPLPKTKQQIEDEIPVNRKPNNTNVGKDNSFIKEAYAQYDKEADSLHTANKKRLDSIMQALNIKVPIVINPNDFIDIYVNGGGTIANNDSKLYDRISILHTGVVQREYKTKNDGVQRNEKKISKDELTKLAQYIVDMGFYDFSKEYDCADDDSECNERFSKSPQVVPLEISVTVGERKNKVKVAIYEPKSEKNYVNYPASLEKIMKAVYTVVEK